MKRIMSIVVCVLVFGLALGQAQSTSGDQKSVKRYGGTACGGDPILPTDGSVLQADYVPTGAANWYYINVKAGHSYAVEIYDSYDSQIGGSATLTIVASNCTTPVQTTDVTSMDPDLSQNFGARMSWIQATDSAAYIEVQSSDPNGSLYNVRIVDTTLVNPRWSTYAPFSTQYSFTNNTSAADITGTLSIYDSSGSLLSTKSITIPKASQQFYIFNTPASHVGFATFAYTGASGAITADAFFLNSSLTVVVPSSFAPRNFQH